MEKENTNYDVVTGEKLCSSCHDVEGQCDCH